MSHKSSIIPDRKASIYIPSSRCSYASKTITKNLRIKNNVPSLCETKEKYKFSDYFVENFVNSRLSVQLKNLKAIEKNKPKILKFPDILFTSTWASLYKNSTKSEQKNVQNRNSKPPHFSNNSSSSSSKCSTVIAKIDQKRGNVIVKNENKNNQSNSGKPRKLFVTFLNNNKKFNFLEKMSKNSNSSQNQSQVPSIQIYTCENYPATLHSSCVMKKSENQNQNQKDQSSQQLSSSVMTDQTRQKSRNNINLVDPLASNQPKNRNTKSKASKSPLPGNETSLESHAGSYSASKTNDTDIQNDKNGIKDSVYPSIDDSQAALLVANGGLRPSYMGSITTERTGTATGEGSNNRRVDVDGEDQNSYSHLLIENGVALPNQLNHSLTDATICNSLLVGSNINAKSENSHDTCNKSRSNAEYTVYDGDQRTTTSDEINNYHYQHPDQNYHQGPSIYSSAPAPHYHDHHHRNNLDINAPVQAVYHGSLVKLLRDFNLRRAKLRAVNQTSALLAGFAMVAMVEVQIDGSIEYPVALLVTFSCVTTLLVVVHLISLMISTCLLPNIEVYYENQRHSSRYPDHSKNFQITKSPDIHFRRHIEVAWILSTGIGLVLMLVEVGLLIIIKFYSMPGFNYIVWIAVGIFLIPATVVFMFFAVQYYRHLLMTRFDKNFSKLENAEHVLMRNTTIFDSNLPEQQVGVGQSHHNQSQNFQMGSSKNDKNSMRSENKRMVKNQNTFSIRKKSDQMNLMEKLDENTQKKIQELSIGPLSAQPQQGSINFTKNKSCSYSTPYQFGFHSQNYKTDEENDDGHPQHLIPEMSNQTDSKLPKAILNSDPAVSDVYVRDDVDNSSPQIVNNNCTTVGSSPDPPGQSPKIVAKLSTSKREGSMMSSIVYTDKYSTSQEVIIPPIIEPECKITKPEQPNIIIPANDVLQSNIANNDKIQYFRQFSDQTQELTISHSQNQNTTMEKEESTNSQSQFIEIELENPGSSPGTSCVFEGQGRLTTNSTTYSYPYPYFTNGNVSGGMQIAQNFMRNNNTNNFTTTTTNNRYSLPGNLTSENETEDFTRKTTGPEVHSNNNFHHHVKEFTDSGVLQATPYLFDSFDHEENEERNADNSQSSSSKSSQSASNSNSKDEVTQYLKNC